MLWYRGITMQNVSSLFILLLSQFYLQVKVAKHWNGFLSHCITYLGDYFDSTLESSNKLVIKCIVKILKTSKSHFAIGSDPIESKALYYHYFDLPILRTSADLKYYHSHLVDFFQIVLHLSDHMIIGCRHPGCLTVEYNFVFIAIFSYLLCFTFLSVLKSVLPFVLVQFWYRISSVSSSVL